MVRLFHVAIACGQAYLMFSNTYYCRINGKWYRWIDTEPKDSVEWVPYCGY